MNLLDKWWFFFRRRRQKMLPVEKKEEKPVSDKTQKTSKIPPIKEELYSEAGGGVKLSLAYSTNDINPMIDKMNATLKRREEKPKSSKIEIPVIKKVKGVMEVDSDGQHYSFKGKGTKEEFTKWFSEYAKKAPSCITCGRIIFPGSPVGECNKGLMHMNFDCCPSGGFFVGHLDNEGKIIPYPPKT